MQGIYFYLNGTDWVHKRTLFRLSEHAEQEIGGN